MRVAEAEPPYIRNGIKQQARKKSPRLQRIRHLPRRSMNNEAEDQQDAINEEGGPETTAHAGVCHWIQDERSLPCRPDKGGKRAQTICIEEGEVYIKRKENKVCLFVQDSRSYVLLCMRTNHLRRLVTIISVSKHYRVMYVPCIIVMLKWCLGLINIYFTPWPVTRWKQLVCTNHSVSLAFRSRSWSWYTCHSTLTS